MRAGLLCWVLAAGCYAPTAPANSPCSPMGDCPDGQFCMTGRCVTMSATLPPDAPIVGVMDRDGDGVPDAVDNCPDVKNADQANEDGDARGDACDLCPHLFEATVADADKDGVGDACDPNPGSPDTMWMFEGFHKGMPAWPGSTNWVAGADLLRVTAAGVTNGPDEYLTLPLVGTGRTYNNFSVSVSVLIESTMGSTDHSMGIDIYDATTMKFIDCGIDLTGSPFLFLSDNISLNKTPAFAVAANTRYALTVTRHGTTYTCNVVGPAGSQTATGTSNVTPRAGDAVQIWAFGVTGQYHSVFVAGPTP
jgi:Thrombospondin type 3 repeat